MKLIDNINNILGSDIGGNLSNKSKLKIAASYFSIYAFAALKKELEKIEELQFVFTAPTFVPNNVTDKLTKENREFVIPKQDREKSLYGTEFEIHLKNQLSQKAIAKECADWIRRKAIFKSNNSNAPMQEFINIQKPEQSLTYMPIQGFTPMGLGFEKGNAISNMVNCFDEQPMVEPTRFIFSHSALREGWDNPNVFVICTLKHSDNVISRRQEVGRGMRIAVNKNGERMDVNYFQGALGEIHKLNNLTVVTNESYKDFVSSLQTEILSSIKARPTQATPDYFKGKIFKLPDGSSLEVTELMGKQINKHLSKHDYIDDNDQLTPKYHEAKEHNTLAEFPVDLVAYTEQIHKLIDSLFDPKALENFTDDGNKKLSNPINQANLERKEFQALWAKINRKAVYQIKLDSEKLIQESISAVERTAVERNKKFVEVLSYKLAEATQNDESSYEQVKAKEMFGKITSQTEVANISIQSQVTYDLVGNIADDTNLTRKTVARILQGINAAVFAQFKLNPEAFIREMSRIINEQQANMVIQGLKYSPLDGTYPSNEIFVSNESIPLDSYKAECHVWDYVVTDSDNERQFVEDLDGADEVVVYAKLPDRFHIPTPFGSYNPDWAIAFNKDKVRQVYFVAETKGSMLDSDLREKEKRKIESAKKFFKTLNEENTLSGDAIKYTVVDSFSSLMNLVK